MTSKELLYVQDAISRESFMENCSCKTSSQLKDITLSSYIKQLETTHTELFNKFLNLL